MTYTLTTRYAPGAIVLVGGVIVQVASITVDIAGKVYYGVDQVDYMLGERVVTVLGSRKVMFAEAVEAGEAL